MEEKILIEACKRMEPLAQKYLYKAFKPTMTMICNRYSANTEDAKDIMQEGFVKVFLNIGKFEEKGSLEGWIKRIMVNTAISHYKKNKLWNQKNSLDNHEYELDDNYTKSEYEDDNDDSNWNKYAELDKETMLKTIQTLNEPFRLVFNMFYIDNLKHKEIAQMMGIDENTSRTRLLRAKKVLQKKLEELVNQSNQVL